MSGDLFLYDDATARKFEPFALTRPAGELRAGAMLVRERWSHLFGRTTAGAVTAPHLAGFDEPGAARAVAGDLPQGAILANARFCPPLASWPDASVWRNDGRVVALVLPRAVTVAELRDGSVPLEELAGKDARAIDVPGLWMSHVWDYVGKLAQMLSADVDVIAKSTRAHASPGAVSGPHAVVAEAEATIEPHVYFDTSAGPVLLRKGATVQAFTRVIGPCVVGEQSIIGMDKISGCSIGDHCRIHGEMSATIVLGHSNKAHDGFVGHSILGRWVNLGAGTITSNLKNTYGTVQLWTPDGVRDTGLQFLGALFGDHAKTGIGTTLTTGCVVGAGANIFGAVTTPKAIPPFAWGDRAPYKTWELPKFIEVARRMMQRRHIELSEDQTGALRTAFEKRWSVDG
jgi:UDP-N-acetylglucosamine diphosphorylase/glucosamine-1-phosphate N-acetyltransferase